jgi:pimeloyl-ACP methyl ester carboxylesterase
VSRIVLVHGLAGSSRWWRPLLPHLEGHDVRAVDLPRGGVARAVDWLTAVLETEGPATLVGHSMGGLVAAEVAAEHPQLVERLVLVSPAGAELGSSRLHHVLPLVQTVVRTRPRVLANLAWDATRTGPIALWRSTGEVVRATVGHLRTVQAPTLVVWGNRDALIPPARADAYMAAIPGARLVVLPHAGHVPMAEAPVELADAINAFLG